MNRAFTSPAFRELAPIYIVMVVVIIANFVLEPNLLSLGSIRDLCVQVAPYALAAMAQTMIMLLAGVDLAVGALMSLSSTLVATQLSPGGPNFLVIIGVAVLCSILGSLTGLFVAALRLPALVVTLAASFIWGGIALLVLPQPGGAFPDDVAIYFTGIYSGVPIVIALIVIALLLWLAVRRSPTGLRIYAVGNAPAAARLTGLSVIRPHVWAFGLGGLFAGLGGIVLSAQTGSGDAVIGTPFTLSSIAAAVIGGVSLFGGKGRMAGAVAGAVIIAMLSNLLQYAGVASFAQYIVQGAILLAIVCFTAWRRIVNEHRAFREPVLVGATR